MPTQTETLSEFDVTDPEPPSQTACEWLAQALSNYEKLATELEEFRGCIALAETDESTALEDQTISEDEVVRRVGEAQKLRAVYTARAARRELEVTKLATELEENCVSAGRELTGLLNAEVEVRRSLVGKRVCQAMDADQEVLESTALFDLVTRFSKPLHVINNLRPAGYFGPGAVAQHAHAILESLDSFKAEVEKGL